KPHRSPPSPRRSLVPRLDVLEDRTLPSAGFGSSGIVTTDFRGPVDSSALAVALQPDGKAVVAGPAGNQIALARYNTDGSLDRTFGAAGQVLTDLSGEYVAGNRPKGLALQSDGKIVVVGGTAVARYNADGSLDMGFGAGGKVT